MSISNCLKKITKKEQQINRLVLQAGVGSFSSGGLFYVNFEREQARKNKEMSIFADDLKIIIVEPTDATCLMENVETYVQNNPNQNNNTGNSADKCAVSCITKENTSDSKQIEFAT